MSEEQIRSQPLATAAQAEPVQRLAEDLEGIYRQHHGLVFRAAYRITGNATDAEDVLQTVFLRLVRRDPAADAVENMESYLHRAAVNTALDLMRSRHNARSIPLEDVELVLTENASLSPDRAYTSGEIREWLRKMVARLSPRAAEMFALRFFEGKGNLEIARTLGTTQSTVAVTLSRARDRIEEEFRAYLGGNP